MNLLNDLYYYLESKTINHPIHGTIPFKLHVFQQYMLKFMHEHDRLLIIKSRQIGASNLLAGYIAWQFNRTGLVSVINSINYNCADDLFRKVRMFEPEYPKLYVDGRGLRAALNVYDEWNFNKNCGKPWDYRRFVQTGKHIITGTPDEQGKLEELYKELIRHGYVVKWFPAKRCSAAWSQKRIDQARAYLTPTQFKHEVEAYF